MSRPDSPVVVVWLPDDVVKDEKLVARIQRETAFVTQLRHPNIYRVLGLECFEEGWARLLAYVEGELLSRALAALRDRQRPLDARFAALIMLNACDGVRFAHEEGVTRYAGRPIVHGALRPDTLFLTFEGSTVVAGFGATVLSTPASGPGLAYLAPEQVISGKATASAATDVYGLGAVLYELLAGEAPFQGEADLERAVLTREPTPIVGAGLPSRLASVAARAMAKRSADRYERVAVLRDAIMDALEGAPLTSHSELGALLEELFPATSSDRVQRRTMLQSALDPDALTMLSRPAQTPAGVDPALFEASRPEKRAASIDPAAFGENADPTQVSEMPESLREPVVQAPSPVLETAQSAHAHLPSVFGDDRPVVSELTGEVTGGQIVVSRSVASPPGSPSAGGPAASFENFVFPTSRDVSQLTDPMNKVAMGLESSREPSVAEAPTAVMAAASPDEVRPRVVVRDPSQPEPSSAPEAASAFASGTPDPGASATGEAAVSPTASEPHRPEAAVSPTASEPHRPEAAVSPTTSEHRRLEAPPISGDTAERDGLLAPAAVPRSPMRDVSSITAFDKAAGDSSKSVLIGVLAVALLGILGVFLWAEPPPEVRENADQETRHVLPKDLVRAALENAGPTNEVPVEGEAEAAPVEDGGAEAATAVAQKGRLEITTEPPVDVYLGSELLGHSPIDASVPAGLQKLRFTDKETGINTYKSYRVKGGASTKDHVVFGSSELVVEAPAGASILLNARFIGKAPLPPVKIYEGKYQLKVTLDGKSWADVFDAPAGRKINYKVTLEN